jgi:phage shock protein C
MTNQYHHLYRSQTNKVIAGVCGGIAEYLTLDATIVRLVWILLTLLGGSGVILYILAIFIVPENRVVSDSSSAPVRSDSNSALFFGILFVAAGVLFLLNNLEVFSICYFWDTSWEFVFPGLLILAGIFLLLKQRKPSSASPEHMQSAVPDQHNENQTPHSDTTAGNAVSPKTLRRSITDKKILGICGGAGEYFDIDPTLIRIVYAIFTVLSGGFGIILYFLLYLIIPESQPRQKKQE